jgi:hypothetical protein
LAVFCLAVLLVALAIAALLSLSPGEEDSTIPQVSVAPQLGIGLGDAVAVTPGQQLAVAPAHLAGIEGPRLAASVAMGSVGDSSGSVVRTALAPAQVVAVPVIAQPPTEPPHSPSSEPAPSPQPVATPVAAPVPTPAPAAMPTRPVEGGKPPRPNPSNGPVPIGGIVSGPVQIFEGDEYAYSFSFYIQPTAYRVPGEDNLILRFGDEADQNHSLGLQLWDDGSGPQRGLWASGDAMGGERFLAPVTEGVWHEIVLYFQASSEDDGLYLLLLDGEPIDTRAWVNLIVSTGGYGLLEAGLFREGERLGDSSEIYFGPARLGESLESVIP